MIPQVTNTLIQSNVQSSHEFSIKTSAFAFDILSDKLYSNKVLAVVREYLTNALDAQKANGVVKPLEVTLPNDSLLTGVTPWEIRDYGTGLTEEQIHQFYCVYFSSSKQETNDFTGMLGLGCKAGFAYTHTFTVTSWINGTESKYLLFKEDGTPKISKLYTKPSDEPTGLKISIVAEKRDIREFRDVTTEVLSYFPEEYIPAPFERYKPTFECKRYFLTNNYQLGVLMGNVLYPVDRYDIGISFGKGITLKLPIGAVPILPSREGLSLDSNTKEFLKNEFNDVFKKVRNNEHNKSKKWGKGYPSTYDNVDFLLTQFDKVAIYKKGRLLRDVWRANEYFINMTHLCITTSGSGAKKLTEAHDGAIVVVLKNGAEARRFRKLARSKFDGAIFYDIKSMAEALNVDVLVKKPTKGQWVHIVNEGRVVRRKLTKEDILDLASKGYSMVRQETFKNAGCTYGTEFHPNIKWVITSHWNGDLDYISFKVLNVQLRQFDEPFTFDNVLNCLRRYLLNEELKVSHALYAYVDTLTPYNFDQVILEEALPKEYLKLDELGLINIRYGVARWYNSQENLRPRIDRAIKKWLKQHFKSLQESYNEYFQPS